MTDSKNLSIMPVEPTNFNDLLRRAFLLKEFAVKNGYEVDPKTIQDLNALRTHTKVTEEEWDQLEKVIAFAVKNGYEIDPKMIQELKTLITDTKVTGEKWDQLDNVIAALTSITFPTTIDNLSEKPESEQYKRFKWWLFFLGIVALIFAILGFVSAFFKNTIPLQLSNSILALSLGLLGAVIYSLFNVLRVVPPQAFNPRDEYSNYARLLLGVLLGWVFYFAFGREVFGNLCNYIPQLTEGTTKLPEGTPKGKTDWMQAFLLLVPFVAGYSTKFVVGILNRVIAALEIALGIEDKRDISARRVSSRRGL